MSVPDVGNSTEKLNQLVSQFQKFHGTLRASLSDNIKDYSDFYNQQYAAYRKISADRILTEESAHQTVSDHAIWMDGWIRFSWWFVLQEFDQLMEDIRNTIRQKLPYLRKTIPRKTEKREQLKQVLLEEPDQTIRMDPAERAYYSNQLKNLECEIETLQQQMVLFEKNSASTRTFVLEEKRLLSLLAVFARGGYGREELTFSSDIDLAYCLDLKRARSEEILIIQELIKRMEALFEAIPADLASQYFELGEDLSRFNRTDMLHTIPSILEGRTIIGDPEILGKLKLDFSLVCPPEKAIRFLKQQMDSLSLESNERFNIKDGYGGVRHLQYVLWMVLIVESHENSNSPHLLEYLRNKGWISTEDKQNLVQALEFYFDLRNFIGLYDLYEERLNEDDVNNNPGMQPIDKDMLDSKVSLAYLKLKQRFVNIDYLDRFRLHSIKKISSLAGSIVEDMLNRTVVETLPGFNLVKHIGSNRVIQLTAREKKRSSTWNLIDRVADRRKSSKDLELERIKDLFLNPDNLFDLFLYIARTGIRLSKILMNHFSGLVEEMYLVMNVAGFSRVKRFVTDLFVADNASIAVRQMMDIASPLSRDGHIKTLLGLIIPEVNQMRYLLRNLEIHEYPLCIHSMKALGQIEIEIENSQKNEPELWRFISEKDVFALKWSTFFHDIGKINPYRDHEKLGPILSTDMLRRLGWYEEDEILDLVRLLISNHQSVVRFSQLSTYLDLGILKFFELAQRDPGKVLLLYLINLSDFKSVNSKMGHKAAHLENFFEKTMSILSEFKREELSGSLTEVVNGYLDRRVAEIRMSVLLELLLRQACNKNLDDVIIVPLSKLSPKEAKSLERYRKELENSLVFLKLAELDDASLEKHRFRFTRIVKEVISEDNIRSVTAPLSRYGSWFFSTVPNRYLLSSRVGTLTTQLQEFEDSYHQNLRLSYVKGEQGEYDSILFKFVGNVILQAKIAYVLSWQGINIENGKINQVHYGNGEKGYVGFFRVSATSPGEILTGNELENVIRNLTMPPLNPPRVSETKKLHNVKVAYFLEQEKGYLIEEGKSKQFTRSSREYVAVKISLLDAPFVYYKILRSFDAAEIVPQQVTITTIGNQIIDYFYIDREDLDRLQNSEFKGVLHKYINADITIS